MCPAPSTSRGPSLLVAMSYNGAGCRGQSTERLLRHPPIGGGASIRSTPTTHSLGGRQRLRVIEVTLKPRVPGLDVPRLEPVVEPDRDGACALGDLGDALPERVVRRVGA